MRNKLFIIIICILFYIACIYRDACVIDNVNFISEKRPTNCSVKFRYRSEDVPVILEYLDDVEI